VIIGLKPRDERSQRRPDHHRLRPQLAKVPGATLFLQAAQDLNVGGRTTRTQYQYTLQDSDINELNDWAPKLLAASCRNCPCCATWPRISRPAAACCR
jgi:HAE1 family hydrophobic/amphiphilic exporter-1